jgi:hypothetical protein
MENYTWHYIQNHPQETRRLLGIDYEQLEQLLKLGKLLEHKQRQEMEKTQKRLIKIGRGNYLALLVSVWKQVLY